MKLLHLLTVTEYATDPRPRHYCPHCKTITRRNVEASGDSEYHRCEKCGNGERYAR